MLRTIQNLTVAMKMLIFVAIAHASIVGFYTYYVYQEKKADLYHALDERLTSTAIAMSNYYGPINDQYDGSNQMSAEEYKNMCITMSKQMETMNVAFVYSMQLDNDGKAHFTSSSEGQEDFDKGEGSAFWEEYTDADPKLFEAAKPQHLSLQSTAINGEPFARSFILLKHLMAKIISWLLILPSQP